MVQVVLGPHWDHMGQVSLHALAAARPVPSPRNCCDRDARGALCQMI